MVEEKKRIRRRKKPSTDGGNGNRPGRPATFYDLLNFRQQKFVKYLLIYPDNPGLAADKAGYRRGLASATMLLKNPKIRAAIQEEKRKLVKRIEIRQERVLEELARIAFFSIDQACTFDGEQLRVKSFEEMDEFTLSAIQEIKTGRSGAMVRSYNKMDALQALGRYFGIYKDKLDLSIGVRLEDVISALPAELGERIRRALVERFSRARDYTLPAQGKVIQLQK